jgi:chromate transporter
MEPQPKATTGENHRGELRALALLFLQLGTTAFGGPAAHIALMEDEVVRRRGWLSHGGFLDMISACNLLPGPNSTEMALHIGQRRAGLAGLVTAGFSFLGPAALITTALAWAYVKFGAMPQVSGVLYGIKPVMIAIVAQAIWRLGRSVLRTELLIVVTIAAIAAAFAGLNEIILLFAAGAVTILAYRMRGTLGAALMPAMVSVKAAAAAVAPFSLSGLFLIFLKIGAIMFGSGYVLLAFLQTDLVQRTHWLTQAQLLDAIAIGQITPGPLSSTATFVGYLLGGVPGAIAATAGIFLPAFCLVTISGPMLERLRRSAIAGAFLDGVNAGSLALMVEVTWELGRAAVVDATTAALVLISTALLIRFRFNSAWLILLGGAAGALTTLHFR